MTLGQRIQELRKQAGLSQEGLGEALGVSRQAVSKWEGDNGIPELDTLIAMSRLFGVTIGQLLGVEEAAGGSRAQETGPTPGEEQVEAILRRYAEESRQAPRKRRYGWKAQVIAAAGLAALVVFIGVKSGSAIATIRNISSRLSYLETNLNNLSGQIGGMEDRIQDILADQSNPVSSFDWSVVGFDPEAETVTVEVRTTLKSYTPETRASFEAGCSIAGENETAAAEMKESGWVSGPEFAAELALPMNAYTEFTLRLELPDGVIQRQELGSAYIGTEDFQLRADSLAALFSISAGSSTTTTAEDPAVRIFSSYPELFRPVSAELTATINGEELCRLPLTLTEEEPGVWCGRSGQGVQEIRLSTGDKLVLALRTTDSLGRERLTTKVYFAGRYGLETPAEPVTGSR